MRESNERNPCEDRGCDCCLHFREEWTAGSIYRPGEAVPYNGSSYVAIHWNQNDPPPSGNWAQIASKGDAGPAGAAGAAGPAGPQGPAGASTGTDVYSTSSLTDPVGILFVPDGIDFAALSLPGGSYVLMATVLMQNVDTDDQNWTLELRQGDTLLFTARGRIGSDQLGSGTVMVPFTANTDSAVGVTVRGYGFNIVVSTDTLPPFSLMAIKVGQILASV